MTSDPSLKPKQKSKSSRFHLSISGDTRRELGLARGAALRATLPEAYAKYAELFRVCGVSEQVERNGARESLEVLASWRPEVVHELEGIAEASGVDLLAVAALNARTEILALGTHGASECSTVTTLRDGHRYGVQTWDWHIELDSYWHTQEVAGPGHRYVGLTEQGIMSKIGQNSAGLALHFNILGHSGDGTSGVPMHALSSVVLAECATVDEAVALIREAPIGSSSAFTMLDAQRAVSVEMSPAGIFEIGEVAGSVQRTNHFQEQVPLAEQKSELYEPDSTERLALVRERLSAAMPATDESLVDLLTSTPEQPPLSCVPDMAQAYGERWATLATVLSNPDLRTLRVLDGMPTEAHEREWIELQA